MARARKSHVGDEENAKSKKTRGIEEAYSSLPHGHRYVIYCTWRKDGEKHPRMMVHKFLATYAAHFFVTKLIGKEEYHVERWVERDKMVITAKGINIRAYKEQIDEILEYEPTEAEAAWRDESLIASINRFRYGPHEGDEAIERSSDRESDGEEESRVSSVVGRKRKPKEHGPVEPRVKSPKSPKVDKSGMVTAIDIAKELGVEGREVRGVLRSSKLKKPEHGWAWNANSEELKTARDAISKGLKDLANKKRKDGKK